VELTRFRGHLTIWVGGSHDAEEVRPPPPYPPEFRRRLIELVRAGQTPEELAKKFLPTAQSIRNWVRQASAWMASRPNREELRQLGRENGTLREEREILKKAAAWFAQETQSTPKKPSGS
jgi:transposase